MTAPAPGLDAGWVAGAIIALDWMIRIGLSMRVVMRRRPVGVSLAWLAVILVVPFVGAAVYLLVGESRLGTRRARRAIEVGDRARAWVGDLCSRGLACAGPIDPALDPIRRHAESVAGFPALPGNRLELLDGAEALFASLLDDVERARERVHMQFYIWCDGGRSDEIAAALVRAAERGVRCRVLVDAVGSRDFLEGEAAASLRRAGAEVVGALPVALWRLAVRRLDLRNHRKIAVIDGRIAYSGSQNLADPRYFKAEAGVGAWVDAMVRVEGPAVEALEGVFLKDWELETGGGLELLAATDAPPLLPGGATVQVVPSGPGVRQDAIHHLLLSTIHAARRELVLTTPYFVPDDSIMDAIVCAAHRGVQVVLIVPAEPDSRLARWAGRSHWEDLLAAGVEIRAFGAGLLHTKAVTVDGALALIGSVNLDMRSFWLNFELTLFVYDPAFAERVRRMLRSYEESAELIDRAAWAQRPFRRRLVENVARLMSPLL